MSLSEILTKDLWPRVLSFVSGRRGSSSTCRCLKEARCALQYVRLIHVDRAAELDVRVLKHFVGATTLSVSARRNVSRAEALAANHLPADFQFSYLRAVGGRDSTGFTTRTSRGACRTRSPRCHSRDFAFQRSLAFPGVPLSGLPCPPQRSAARRQSGRWAGQAPLSSTWAATRVACSV